MEDKTDPLPADEPASSVEPASLAPADPVSAIESAPEPPQKQPKAVRGRNAVGQDDAVYGSAVKRAKRQQKTPAAPAAVAMPLESEPRPEQTSFFRRMEYESDEICSEIRVPQGTVVRVVVSHAMDRVSDFMSENGLNLDNRR